VTSEEWLRARGILELALKRPPAERRGSVAELCAGNALLRAEIEAMLASYDESSDLESFLEQRQRAQRSGLPFPSPANQSADRTRTADLRELVEPDAPAGDPFPNVPRWAEFALLEQIGEGAFGVVYRAWDSLLKREIALKIIDIDKLPRARNDTLLREGQMLARVRHHNVVTVYRAERIGRQVGLAMEYINGRTLSNLIAQHGPLSAQEASLIGSALCDALSAVHRGGLLHRDVKASNVMRESGGRIVLMDFGAGRELLREAGTWSRLLGTPVYMPPEVLRGGPATASADIYSLGVLVFFLVSGRYPIEGTGFEDVVSRHDEGQRLSLPDVRHDLPDSFVALVERATHADASQRPRSASAFKRELLEAVPISVRHKLIDTKQGTREGRVVRPARRWTQLGLTQRVALSLLGVFLVLIALGFLTTLEFNSVLGRTAAFGTESPLGIFRWGANSLLAPTIYVALIVLLFNAAMFLARLFGRVAPPIRRAALGALDATLAWARRAELDNPNDLLRGLSVLGLAALVVILWNFLPLLKAFVLQINQAPSSDLAVLGSDNNTHKFLYRRLLELDLLLLCVGTFAVFRLRRQKGVHLAPSAVASTIAVIGLVLVFLVGPWRLMFHSKFPQASLDGEACFVLATQGADALLHCPQAPPPRNRIVRSNDPKLQASGPIAWLFDAHQVTLSKSGR
jgi:serine/threonine protein kinase